MAESSGSFPTCHHNKTVAKRNSRGGPWRPFFCIAAGSGGIVVVEEARWRRKMTVAWRKVIVKWEKGGAASDQKP